MNGENPFLKRKRDRLAQLAKILESAENLTYDKAKLLDEFNFGVSPENAEHDIHILVTLGTFERSGAALRVKKPLSPPPSTEG